MSAIPEGFKLVPVEPTLDMCLAGASARIAIETPTPAEAAYKAMLAAAPQPPDHVGEANKMVEPFGYFKPDPFGWTDCDKSDEGARPLYEHPPVSPAKPGSQSEPLPTEVDEAQLQRLRENGAKAWAGVVPAQWVDELRGSEMAEAVAAVDGTLHGAIDHWQQRALKAEAALRAKNGGAA